MSRCCGAENRGGAAAHRGEAAAAEGAAAGKRDRAPREAAQRRPALQRRRPRGPATGRRAGAVRPSKTTMQLPTMMPALAFEHPPARRPSLAQTPSLELLHVLECDLHYAGLYGEEDRTRRSRSASTASRGAPATSTRPWRGPAARFERFLFNECNFTLHPSTVDPLRRLGRVTVCVTHLGS